MDFDFKIIFWVLAIGFYIYTQIKDSLKKDNRTDSIPTPIPKLPSIPGMNQNRTESKPIAIPTITYSTPVSKRYQSKYNRAEEIRRKIEGPEKENTDIVSREAFYKQEVQKPIVVNYEEPQNNPLDSPSIFGVDQHLKPYEMQAKQKHPLITFLSNKNNLKNAFITGEVLRKRD
ncbi:hypothetical protein [Cytophaga aurantiaca]|uniref:hypothetical protein n=1 Tax=Cytophaga aurantiaca TaxID=29530 RepID=UPI000377AE7D|nr:hypothetical protein [Cytophaga aurantiaca]